MYTYDWVHVLYTWNCHNIVNQPYSNIKWKVKEMYCCIVCMCIYIYLYIYIYIYIYIVVVPCWCVNSRIWSLSVSCLPQSRCHISVCSRIDSPLFFPKCAHIQRKSDKFPWQTHGTERVILHLVTHLIHMVFRLSRTSVQKVWSPDPAAPVSPWNYCIRVNPCNGCPDDAMY